jgi:hypothetical protein
MAEEPALNEGDIAVAEPPTGPTPKPKKKQDEDLEYEVEFATPFGKLEFEFEPLERKEKKDKERKEKAAREAAKKAEKAAERAALAAERGSGGRGILGTLLIIFIVLAVLGAIIAAAYWLFARPGEEEDEAVPPEFQHEPQPAAQGFVARTRGRLSDALRAGRQASREAQREQREKFEQMSRGR